MATTVPLFFIGMMGVGLLSGWLSERQISLLGGRWLDAKLAQAVRVIRENHDVLVRFGLEHVEANAQQIRAAAWNALREVPIGSAGYIFVVDTRGVVLMHPQADEVGTRVDTEPWFAAMSRQEEGKTAFTRDGSSFLAVFRSFPPWNCYVLVAAPQREVMGAVDRLRLYVLGCAMVVATLVGILVMLLARRLTQPLHQLVEDAERIGRGDLETPVRVVPGGETTELARSVQVMRIRLRELYAGLEQRIAERERAEEALRRSEARFRTLLDESPVGLVIVTEDGLIPFRNKRFMETVQWSEDDVPNVEQWWLLAYPERAYRERAMAAWAASLAAVREMGARATPLVATVTCGDGAMRDIEFRHAAIGDRLLIMMTDVTELKRSEEKYRAIFENATEGMFQTTPDGRYITANTAMARFFGYNTAEELIESVTDIGSQSFAFSEERERFKRIMEEKGTVQGFESRYRRIDGTMAWAAESARAVRDADGTILYYEGFLEDITERIINERTTRVLYQISRAISTTRDLGELYATIHAILNELVDTTNFFIALVDERHDRLTFTYCEDEQGHYYDISNISDPATQSMTLEVIRTGRPLFMSSEEFVRHKGLQRPAAVGTAAAIWLGVPLTVRGKVIGAMAVQHYTNPRHYTEADVRLMEAVSEQVAVAIERKSYEEALTRLNEELESMVDDRTEALRDKARELEEANRRLVDLDEMKSAFLSSVSHELRTPLTSVLGFAKLIRRDFQNCFMPLVVDDPRIAGKGHRAEQNLNIIIQEGERLTRLINDVLDLDRIEKGRVEWRDELVCLSDALHMAARSVEGHFGEKPQVSLRLDFSPHLPCVVMDSDRLQQILINLLHNAIKFTDRGEVGLGCDVDASGEPHIVVRDTGQGINACDLENVFDKFYQTCQGDTTTDKPKGTGLGLAISRHIVEHYGGRIWAESCLGQGSAFHVRLPASVLAPGQEAVRHA
ncbi:MAG: PAS domain S-box protein [Desulfovibrionaceae bacterium]